MGWNNLLFLLMNNQLPLMSKFWNYLLHFLRQLISPLILIYAIAKDGRIYYVVSNWLLLSKC